MRRYTVPLVLSLMAVLSVSGCTAPVETGNGVVIQEFAQDLESVYPGEPITFQIKFKNTGSVDASGIFAELLGLDEDWYESSFGMGPSRSNEILPSEGDCQYTGYGQTLKAPDIMYGTEGETGTCSWNYRAPPTIPEGFNPRYDIVARLFYEYRTDVVKSITLLPTEELVKYNQQGRSLPTSTVSSTRSPITITATARDPVRFWGSEVSFPLAITISNTGGGTSCLKGRCKQISGAEWNKVFLKIDVSRNRGIRLGSECSEYIGGKEVDVWTNRDNTITCDIIVSDVSNIVGYEEKTIVLSAEYSYFIDSESSITVL